MKILFVSNSYRPYQGGVVQSIEAVMNELKVQQHEVHLMTLDFQREQNNLPEIIKIPSFFVFNYKKNAIALPKFPYHALKHYITYFMPDIIHVHHPFFLGPMALIIAQQKNIPVVFTYHTQYEEYAHYAPFFSQLTQLIIRKQVLNFCKRVNGIVFPSFSIQKKVSQQFVCRNSIVLPSPIKNDFFLKSFLKKSFQFPVRLLYVGRVVPEKNINFLIDMMKYLDSYYQLRIVGYGSYLNTLKRYAYVTHKLSTKQIVFIENPARDLLLQEYAQAHFFLFASTTETQGLVLAEAMAFGLPVIALYAPGSIDIVQPHINGYLIYNDFQMAECIKSIDESLYQSLSLAAFKTAQRYNPTELCQQLISWYNTLRIQAQS